MEIKNREAGGRAGNAAVVRYDVVFRGGALDGHATQRYTLPEFIAVPASTGTTLQLVRYVRKPSVLSNGPVVYELDVASERN